MDDTQSELARKPAAAIAVLLLHIVIIAALLATTFGPKFSVSPARETILWLTPPTKQKPASTPASSPGAPSRRALALPHEPGNENGKTLQKLHGQLFDCRPENLPNLTAEQRAVCASAISGMKPGDSLDYAEHPSRSLDAAHWAAGLARKQAPLLLPCASPQSAFATVGLGTILCLGVHAVTGFDLDAMPEYANQREPIHVPNNGDPTQIPPQTHR